MECKGWSVPNTVPATQNDIPHTHTMDLHYILPLPRKMTLSRCPTLATQFARCHLLTQPLQCNSQKTRNTTRLSCCACHATCRWTRPKCCTCHETECHLMKMMQTYFACHTERILNMLRCHKVPRLPHETRLRDV